jgi:hypothetical protein
LLIAICSLLIISCEQPSGVQVPEGRFTFLEDLSSYMVSKPENTPETPYPIALSNLDLSHSLNPLFAAFQGRYVSLDLSGCVLREIPAEQNIAARENKDRLVSLTLPPALQSIGSYAFYQSSSLTTLVLPDSLRDIRDSAFAECGIEELELPSRLQSLGGSAFAYSPALRSVSIPSSLGVLGDYAFAGCSALVQCLVPDSPPDLATAVFAGCGESLVFFVPDDNALTLYRSALSWQLYRSQLAPQNPGASGIRDLYFDYGRRRSPLDNAGNFSYASPVSRPLVLAPVLWGIRDDADFEWKVDGQVQSGATGRYFTFTPGEQKTYTVVCSAGGLSAETRVTGTASESGTKRPKTAESRRQAMDCFDYSPAPGELLGVQPPIDFSDFATEETVRQKSEDKLRGKDLLEGGKYEGWSLGDGGGYVIFGFDHSVEKRATGGELYIKGNAPTPSPTQSGDDEPGVVWVMQDSNGNGKPDDVWYELRGEAYSQNYNIHRYALTWFRPYIKGGTSHGSWVDNRGKSGTHYSANFPFSVKGASVTFALSYLEYDDLDYSVGYVDIYKCDTFNIADAVQADGTPINLTYVDFVKVQSACFNPYKGKDLSTELAAPEDASMPADNAVMGEALGAGMYRYRFINESRFALTVTVQDYGPVTLSAGESRTLDLAFQRRFWKLSRGSQQAEAGEGTLTFYD